MSLYKKEKFKYKRSARVAGLIQEEVARLLQRGLKDPRLKRVNIVDVEVSDDLRQADVYFNTLGGEKLELEQIDAAFSKAAGFIRREVGKYLSLKNIPHFSFYYDDGLDRANRIDKILRDARQQHEQEID